MRSGGPPRNRSAWAQTTTSMHRPSHFFRLQRLHHTWWAMECQQMVESGIWLLFRKRPLRMSRSGERSDYLGGIRIAPSRRMHCPLKYPLRASSRTRLPNSGGLPSRLGNGTEAARPAKIDGALSFTASIGGVAKIPGRMAFTRMPRSIRSRAIGRTMELTAPLPPP